MGHPVGGAGGGGGGEEEGGGSKGQSNCDGGSFAAEPPTPGSALLSDRSYTINKLQKNKLQIIWHELLITLTPTLRGTD